MASAVLSWGVLAASEPPVSVSGERLEIERNRGKEEKRFKEFSSKPNKNEERSTEAAGAGSMRRPSECTKKKKKLEASIAE